MLQSVISIKNVGRFKNCVAARDVQFSRFTLIYGENGRGKTTICAILRSLATNVPALIIGRKTLGYAAQPEIQLRVANGNISFRDGAWSADFPDIVVFDGTYVSENVFAGDVVDTDHRRNLYRVIIGAQGVALASEMNSLEEQIRGKNAVIRENKTKLQRHAPLNMAPEAFIELPENEQIDAAIAEKEQELQAVKRGASLQVRVGLTSITAPVFPAAFAQLLAKNFAGTSTDVERRIAEHVARHQMETQGEAWLTDGLKYVAFEECPFCGQEIGGLDLIQAYRSFFSEEYHALRGEVNALSGEVVRAIGEWVSAAVDQVISQNANSIEFWREYCEIVPPALLEVGKAAAVMSTLKQSAQSLLQAKAWTPLDPVAPDEGFTLALAAFEELRQSLGIYNATVATANAVIAARKKQVQATNVRDVESALAQLRAQKARHTAEVQMLCALDVSLQAQKLKLEQDKTATRTLLDTHTDQVITQYGQSIGRYLERINAGFQITTPTHTYRGGAPSTSYQIVINRKAVDLGDSQTPADQPSFRNTLSAGDKSTLALAFFLAQLDQDANRASKVVVFDDPFASMDSFRRNHTACQIQKCGEASAQTVVLSHEASFLKLLWERIPPADRKTLQLARVGEENTTIAKWDIGKAVQGQYRADMDTLQRFFSSGEGDPRDVVQKLRPVLEAHCHNVCPTGFDEQEMMGSMIGKIRDAGVTHPLHSIMEDLDELNVYCRRYHHARNQNAATELIDDGELQGYVSRTLILVGCPPSL